MSNSRPETTVSGVMIFRCVAGPGGECPNQKWLGTFLCSRARTAGRNEILLAARRIEPNGRMEFPRNEIKPRKSQTRTSSDWPGSDLNRHNWLPQALRQKPK